MGFILQLHTYAQLRIKDEPMADPFEKKPNSKVNATRVIFLAKSTLLAPGVDYAGIGVGNERAT